MDQVFSDMDNECNNSSMTLFANDNNCTYVVENNIIIIDHDYFTLALLNNP